MWGGKIMFCKNCGKELKKGAAFCHECGAKVELNETVQANPIETNVPQPAMANNGVATSIKKMSKEKLILIIAIPIWIIIIIACAVDGGTASDDDYISAARTVISKQLKAPSTAIYSNEKIEAQDDYGRTIVSLTVESQNSFGGYVTNSCYVLIESYDTAEDTFTYNKATGVYVSEFGDSFADTYIDKLKESTEWDKPLEE